MDKAADGSREHRGITSTAHAGEGGSAQRRSGGRSMFHIYKPGQGAYVRWGTAAGAGVILIGLAEFLRQQLSVWQNEWIEYLVPAVVLVVLGFWAFRMLGQSRTVVDFMIATEGEMKKVNWSSRREVLGATKVVIATVIGLGFVLFSVNVVFMFVFEWMGVLRVGMLKQLFGGGAE